MAPPPRNRSILICCMGTRGDVQPFVALALHLQQQRGWRAVLAAPPEFRGFITSHGLQHEDIGISLAHAFAASPQASKGKALRTASALNAFQATHAFFRLPLLESWFAGVRRLLLALRPGVLLLTSFVAMSGAAALPEILGLPTRVAMAHTIPMHATGEFGMPLAGTGFSAPTAWLNRTQWGSLDVAVARTLHLPRAQAIVDEAIETSLGHQAAQVAQLSPVVDAEARQAAAADLEAAAALLRSRTRLKRGLAAAPVPTLYIWSPALLPKPEDWPQHTHVVGPLLLRRQLLPQPQADPLPVPDVPAAATAAAPVAVEIEAATAEEEGIPHHAAAASQPVRSCSTGGSTASAASDCSACHIVPGTPASPDAAAPPSPGSESDAGSSHAAASDVPLTAYATVAPAAVGPAAAIPSAATAPVVVAAPLAAPTPAATAAEPPVGLPADLQQYLDAALRRQLPVVYIGLGSMLATVFEPQQVSRLISSMVQAVERAAAKVPLCAVIHTTLPPANQAPGRSSSPSSGAGAAPGVEPVQLAPTAAQLPGLGGLPPYFLLRQAVPHELLLPQVDLAVHHGGAGTTQAVLLAGKPALVIPCVPSSDQPFWADLVARRGLGPPGWFPVKRLTPARLAAGILAGLNGLDGYTRAAEALAFEMAQEDGVAEAGAVLESCLLG